MEGRNAQENREKEYEVMGRRKKMVIGKINANLGLRQIHSTNFFLTCF